MNSYKKIKVAVVGGWLLGSLLLVGAGSVSKSSAADDRQTPPSQPQGSGKQQPHRPEDFVGSDTCATCHEERFKEFSRTPHSRLVHEASWKGKVVGCESCHGPGRAHVEAGGDRTLIRTFDNEPPKQISDTCLSCHAGREEHNNYRRGEHWRNDVGCTDCHFSHAPDPAPPRAESHTLISERTRKAPDSSVLRMLKGNEAQLCLRCHEEQKADFSRPFRHKVLEGVMKCSDCHNPHGGFELKQTRLANFSASEAVCVKCHTDKAGPFVYEHGPVSVEGCSSCHTPHGASNSKLLKRNEIFQLCIECHTNAHAIGLGDEEGAAPNTPSFHNLLTERIRNCTTCHTMIHGSQTHPFFFR
jgi:DmsE family decaheme c-type cytochrome